MEQTEYVTKVFAALPAVIDGLKAMNVLIDLDIEYHGGHTDINYLLDQRIIVDRYVNEYGQKYLEAVEFFDHHGIDPYPVTKAWLEANSQFAEKWGIKETPWWKKLLRK
jgi:hypothetical protein